MIPPEMEMQNRAMDRARNAGSRKMLCGNILSKDVVMAFSALRQSSPLQKPVAKLLNHSMAGGSGQRGFAAIAGSMRATSMRLEERAERRQLTKPDELFSKPDSNREERYSLFS